MCNEMFEYYFHEALAIFTIKIFWTILEKYDNIQILFFTVYFSIIQQTSGKDWCSIILILYGYGYGW